jgi:hypothetical protein
MSDYIPTKDMDFLLWTQNIAQFCEDNAARLKLDSAQIIEYRGKTGVFEQILKKTLAPDHSSVDVAAKNSARSDLESASRDLIQGGVSHNHAVTDEDRIAMGLKPKDHTRTPSPTPASRPEAKVSGSLRQITVDYHDEGSLSRGKPSGVRGCEIRFDLLAGPPANIEDLRHTASSTSSPYIFNFEEHDRGKHLYFALRWENTRGEKGPWSQLYDLFVP